MLKAEGNNACSHEMTAFFLLIYFTFLITPILPTEIHRAMAGRYLTNRTLLCRTL
jgi:hypothetical protein